MQARFLLGLLLPVLAALAALSAGTVSANPSGLFVDNEVCSGGTVTALLHWTPDSAGLQLVDLSLKNDNFTSAYSTAGPYTSGQNQEELSQLKPSSAYYLRVSTLIGSELLRSSTLKYTTRSCSSGGSTNSGTASPPSNLQAAPISATSARFQWVPGKGNHYFCVDYAQSASDLLNIQNTWRNSGCGTTANAHVVTNLACGTTYYARVWTPSGGGLYSPMRTVKTYSCATAISAPTNLAVVFETKTTARVDWEPGKDNRWFCVDTAKSQSDLLGFKGTWRNHGCWTSASQLTISGLSCETLYYWRVYAWNPITNIHSSTSTLTTDDCDSELVKAPIEDVDVDKVGADYHVTIIVGKENACQSFASYESEISGNVIKIALYNSEADEPVCADVYSTYTLTINLGHAFINGVTYVVVVNDDESDAFTAS
jgi:Fibronectin type III domain